MPNQESLQRFFCCLLAMEKQIFEQWRIRAKSVIGGTQIFRGSPEPGSGFRNESKIRRHKAVFPLSQ